MTNTVDLDVIAEYMAVAYRWSTMSPDKSNQNGAVIVDLHNDLVMSVGYNHFPPGVPPTDERPAKYERIAHAEFNSVCQLANSPYIMHDEVAMICPWATCANCALSLLSAGIPNLYIHRERCFAFESTRSGQTEDSLKNWQPAIDESAQWLKDGGCTIHTYSGPVPFSGVIKINGRDWSPLTLEFLDA